MNDTLHAVLRPSAHLRGHIRLAEWIPDSTAVYTGTYTAVPSAEIQILPTKGKKMTADVTILAIPIREYENESGGLTLIVGG